MINDYEPEGRHAVVQDMCESQLSFKNPHAVVTRPVNFSYER